MTPSPKDIHPLSRAIIGIVSNSLSQEPNIVSSAVSTPHVQSISETQQNKETPPVAAVPKNKSENTSSETTTTKKTATSNYAPNGTYTNVYGNKVPSPYYNDSVPAGATAQCRDGTYSFSQSRRGTCSHHGGVDEWY